MVTVVGIPEKARIPAGILICLKLLFALRRWGSRHLNYLLIYCTHLLSRLLQLLPGGRRFLERTQSCVRRETRFFMTTSARDGLSRATFFFLFAFVALPALVALQQRWCRNFRVPLRRPSESFPHPLRRPRRRSCWTRTPRGHGTIVRIHPPEFSLSLGENGGVL